MSIATHMEIQIIRGNEKHVGFGHGYRVAGRRQTDPNQNGEQKHVKTCQVLVYDRMNLSNSRTAKTRTPDCGRSAKRSIICTGRLQPAQLMLLHLQLFERAHEVPSRGNSISA